MYIAICDDEEAVLDKLNTDISRFFETNHRELSPVVSLFHDEKALLDTCERKQFDAIFLDIFLEKANGFEVSKQIREKDDKIAIVFCSSSPDFALGGYTVSGQAGIWSSHIPSKCLPASWRNWSRPIGFGKRA